MAPHQSASPLLAAALGHAGCCTVEDKDEDALREAELEEELRQLEEELRQLGGSLDVSDEDCQLLPSRRYNTGGTEEDTSSLHLEDLPVERFCIFLPAAGFATLRLAGGAIGSRIAALVQRLSEHLREAGGPEPPLLLPLLRFFHSMQAPHFELSASSTAATSCSPEGLKKASQAPSMSCLRVGHAVQLLVQDWAGPAGAEHWCPLRLEGTGMTPASAQRCSGMGAYVCSIKLGGHITPRILKLKLHCEHTEVHSTEAVGEHGNGRAAELEVGISFVDSSVPKQPLFSLARETVHLEAENAGSRTVSMLRATVREVVSCRGRGAWAYRQNPWSLGVVGSKSEKTLDGAWMQIHVEFDWEAALCAALVDGRVEGPLQLTWRPEFGAEPTFDELQLQLAPGVTAAFAELLVSQ